VDQGSFFQRIFSKQPSVITLGLQRMQKAYGLLGSPCSATPVLLIGGTNGKGSTAAVASIALSNRGLRTGLYTSPHLLSFKERISVSDLKTTVEELERIYAEMESQLPKELWAELTFFEATTLLALSYFFYKDVDVLVIEVGLGGRLDATNILSPLVSVVTSIDFDHMNWLGHSLVEIGREKLGIARSGRPLFLGSSMKFQGLEPIIHETSAQVYWPKTRHLPSWIRKRGATFCRNAELASDAVEMFLQKMNIHFNATDLELNDYFPPSLAGRSTEIVIGSESIFCDIAHNPSGVGSLLDEFRARYGAKRVPVFLSALADKDVAGILNKFSENQGPVVFFRTNSVRGIISKAELSSLWPGKFEWYDDFSELWKVWGGELHGRGSAIVGGSFSAVSAALEFFGAEDISSIDYRNMEFHAHRR
jgi:dihydrofolate synthase/folylpolyglutamate synthase